MILNLKNFVIVEVSTGYDASATSIVLKTGEGVKLSDPDINSYNLVWFNSTDYASPDLDPNVEIIKVTNIVTDTLTIVRPVIGNNYLDEGDENIARDHNIAGKQYKMLMAVTKSLLDRIAGDKASGSDIDTGTDDDKYVTPKGIRDSGVLNSEVAGEINAITEKVTLDDDDVFLLEDSADSYNKKRVKKSNIATNLTKASGSDIDTGTDDAKYVTSKSITDSKVSFTDGVETLTNKTLTSPVVNSPTGIVKGDIGLGNVDNTSDTTKNSATATLTNKRINVRIISAASYTTDTGTSLDISVCDEFVVTAQAGALKFNNPSGTPTEGQKLIIRIKDNGTANALTYDTQFRASTDLALPITTVLSKTLYMGFIFNNTDTKWDLVAVLNNI